ncbi:MAG: hypothetical protein HZA78_10610 [Candidatus Schekmanbacteria bacterium]|nr:hypothetical protein [Candidatus Schekmanbacteria bacterium]
MPISKQTIYVIGNPDNKQTLTAGQSTESSLINLDMVSGLVFGSGATFGATPNGNVKVEVFSAPDDNNPDTENYALMELTYLAGQTVRKSRPVTGTPVKAKLKITNTDTVSSVQVWGFFTKDLRF